MGVVIAVLIEKCEKNVKISNKKPSKMVQLGIDV